MVREPLLQQLSTFYMAVANPCFSTIHVPVSIQLEHFGVDLHLVFGYRILIACFQHMTTLEAGVLPNCDLSL